MNGFVGTVSAEFLGASNPIFRFVWKRSDLRSLLYRCLRDHGAGKVIALPERRKQPSRTTLSSEPLYGTVAGVPAFICVHPQIHHWNFLPALARGLAGLNKGLHASQTDDHRVFR